MSMIREKTAGLLRRHWVLILAGVLAACLTVGGVYLGTILLDPYDCRILEGVSIGGLEVGGMTRREAREALASAAEKTLGSMDLKIHLPKETISISPEELNIRLAERKAVADAYRLGRTGKKEERTRIRETAMGDGYDLGLTAYLTWEEACILEALQSYADRYDTVLTQPSVTLEGAAPELGTDSQEGTASGQIIRLTLGLPEQHLEITEVYGQAALFLDGAIGAGQDGEYGIQPEVRPEVLPEEPDLEAIFAQYCSEPVDDSLDMEAYVLIPGAYGYRFDMAGAKALVEAGTYGETISIPMELVEPEILGEEVYFRDVLGTCETKHNDNENRNTNLRLVCQFLDGYVIAPGEEFSYNGAVGERTPERGFKPAPAYSGMRLIQDYGGGVCQGSTTLYNCLLLADMEVTDRVCHGALVSYVPRGLDAAVNWATKTDLAFRNNSHFPVMIRAEVSDGYVKMKLLGTDEKDYYIEMESTSSENEKVIYSASYKCKYDKETGQRLSRELEARSTYYKDLG